MGYERSQEEEMALALKERRQPSCVYCEMPLDRILEEQYELIEWTWDKGLGKYVKREREGDSDGPYHPSCGVADWGYVDGEMVSY